MVDITGVSVEQTDSKDFSSPYADEIHTVTGTSNCLVNFFQMICTSEVT